MTAPTVVILAAGEGTRMRSKIPKVLHEICGRPLIEWVIAAARDVGAGKIVVVDSKEQKLSGRLSTDVEIAIQPERDGTGGAVRAAKTYMDPDSTVLILNGDVPLISAEVLRELTQQHERTGAAATMVTTDLEDPSGYGRVVRDSDGQVAKIVETKTAGDATPEELEIREINTGIFAFTGRDLHKALTQISADNSQREFYLPDVLPALRSEDKTVLTYKSDDASLLFGVNDRVELAHVTEIAQKQIHERHQRAGVTIKNPSATTIDADVTIGQDTTIEQGCVLTNATTIGEGCTIGPLSTVINSVVGDRVVVLHSYLDSVQLQNKTRVGPFAYLRPGAVLEENAKAGTFVEIKNSTVGPGAKVPHLSYIGDTEIGADSNIGAGTITANYDGVRKHRTRIGERVRLGVDTSLIAPVEIGDDAYTGAGSVIVKDVPPRALGIARERQRNIEEYAERVHHDR